MIGPRRAFWVIALLAAPAMGDDWTHLGLDAGRTREPGESITGTITALPAVATGSESAASPVAADGFLVTTGLDGKVRAFQESDRSPLWTTELGYSIIATPLVDRGRVYVPCTNGTVSVLRLADGAILWTARTGGADRSSPVLSGTKLYLGSGFPNTEAVAIDTGTHAVARSTPLEQVTSSSPALAGGKVILGCNSGRVYALDAPTLAEAWSYPTGGTMGPSSPLVDGSSVYVLSGSTFHRVDVDSSAWAKPGVNWTIPLVDSPLFSPPPPGASVLWVDWAASSPAKAGGLIVFTVRFNYHMDLSGPDGVADTRILREVAFAIEPAFKSIAWQALLGEITVPDMDGIPPYHLSPAPVSVGTGIAFASSVTPSLQILSAADGSAGPTFALDAACLASPIVANARILVLTRAGTLHAFQGTNAPPGAVTGLAPNGIELDSPPTLSWSAAKPGATYRVRLAADGEVLMDWDWEATTAGTSVALPLTLANGVVYTWAVRARDALGACGPWSVASFGLNLPPQPPSALSAVPKHQKVLLSWNASPSSNVAGYQLQYGPTPGALGAPVSLGLVTSTAVTGLANGTLYTFELRAVDDDGDLSTPVRVRAMPVSLISIGGTSYDTLAAAALAALPGQTIQLDADTFSLAGTVHLGPSVHLRGLDALVTQLQASGAFDMIVGEGGNSIGLLSISGGSVGVRARGRGLRIFNLVIRGMSDAGVLVEGDALVVNDTIVGNANAGVRSTGSAVVRNAIVQGNGVGLAGSIVSSFNDVSDGTSGVATGAGSKADPVTFLDAAAGDYREAPSQPSLDAGDPADDFSQEPAPNGGRINMGAFGNTPLAATSPVAASSGPSSSNRACSAGAGLASPVPAALAALALLAAFLRRRR
jgi:hypothetical protein